MKRILALTLSLAMLAGLMTVSAVAAEPQYSGGKKPQYYDGAGTEEANEVSEKVTNGGGVNWTNEYTEGDTIAIGESAVNVTSNTDGASITHVYAVNFTMPDALTFTYGSSSQYTWNPETMSYDMTSPGTDNWSADGKGTITVRNYSDLPVEVTASFDTTDQASQLAGQNINVYFDTASADFAGTDTTATVSLAATHTVVEDDVSQTLTNANDATVQTGNIHFRIDGSLTTSANALKLGDIVLTFKVPAAGG